MRQRRVKLPAAECAAAYHCITRTVNGERLFGDAEKEVLRRHLWQIADFCGVRVITYAILSNHFHVLLYVPLQTPISDEELLRRYHNLFPRSCDRGEAQKRILAAALNRHSPEADLWRQRLLAQMGDVSHYMKLVKQRFSAWFNSTHNRFGTLWAERFKSVLVDGNPRVLQAVAAYIDLNGVRAGMVSDPKDYRFCGYAEAVAGKALAREGIQQVVNGQEWDEVHALYRTALFGTGTAGREGAAAIPHEELQRVIDSGGRLPLSTLLHCRLRYLTDGMVLGTRAFVETQLARQCTWTSRGRRAGPQMLPTWTDWDDWAILHTLRGQVLG